MCTMCTVQLFRAFNCNDVKCPCCYSETPVIPSELKPAPPLVQALLSNVMVHCITCTRDMRACEYNTHECSVSPTRTEVQMASQVLTRLADTSPDKIFSMPTKGTVSSCSTTYTIIHETSWENKGPNLYMLSSILYNEHTRPYPTRHKD